MRNLKKLFAVVMVVAMIASMMVPALAAEGLEYEDEAAMLQDLNLFQGYGNGDLGLEDDLTREQGLALMLRVMGLEEDVKAMTEEEIATELARVVDPETITATWARPYVAYAVKNGLTNGIDASILPNIKFAGQLQMNGQEFINFMLNGMGYRTAWNDVLAKAAEVGMLSAGEAVSFGTIAVMRRDDAVGIMSNALNGTTSEGITLAEALVEAGAVDEDKMIEYGYITPTVEPTEAPVEFAAEATVTNLAQINVEFNRDVDKDSAEDTGNYEIDDVEIADATLQDDGVTVVLTFAWDDALDQQDVVDLVIDGVKDLDGEVMDEFTIEDIEFIDTDIPTAIDAAVVGCDTIKVTFSEPMKGDADNELKKADFSVNGGKSYVKEVRLQNNNTEAMVELYNDLKEGEITLQVKSGSEDFAGFGVIGKLFTLEVVPDEEEPVAIGYEKATRSEVTLIWNEDIEPNGSIDFDDFYHTNSKNPANGVEIDGNKMTITFDDDYLLPNGTAYVYVLKEAVRDLWDNENAQQMVKIEVEVDETAPEVDKIDVKDENKIEIKFTEELDEDSAEDDDNYTILDDDGDEVKKIIDKIDYSSKKVTMTFEEDLNGDYSIVIEDVEDKAGNKMSKTVVDFFVGDKTAPDTDEFSATLYRAGEENQMLRIDFADKMATEGKYSVLDVEKYVILDYDFEDTAKGTADVNLEDIDGVEIEIVDDGEAIEIYIPSEKDFDEDEDTTEGEDWIKLTDDYTVQIARVADAAGNKIGALFTTVDIAESAFVDITKAEATARDTIEITFDDELADFEADDIVLRREVKDSEGKVTLDKYEEDEIAGVDTKLNKDGNTVAIFTLDDDDDNLLDFNVGEDNNNLYVYVELRGSATKTESANRYDKTLQIRNQNYVDGSGEAEAIRVADKIKPELYDWAGTTDNKDYANQDDAARFVKDYLKITVTDETYFDATIYFSEEIEILDGDYSLAGSDFEIYLDNDKLVNRKDYEVIEVDKDGNGVAYLTIRFVGEDVEDLGQEFKGDLEIGLKEDREYITDVNDNILDKFDTIEIDNLDLKNYEEQDD